MKRSTQLFFGLIIVLTLLMGSLSGMSSNYNPSITDDTHNSIESNNEISQQEVENKVQYSSYLPGSDIDYGTTVTTDAEGNFYVAGYTQSSDFVTLNAFDDILGTSSGNDGFLMKFDSSGTLLFSTLIGGDNDDKIQDIYIDTNGRIHLIGETQGNGFPTTSDAFNSTHTSGYDGFYTVLSGDGQNLVYSTYIGGSNNDYFRALDVDSSGAFITGFSGSADFPTTSDAYNDSTSSTTDIVFLKVNTMFNLEYSTYIGGTDGTDEGYGLATSNGNVYLTGEAGSTDIPASGLQPNPNGGGDAFIAKFNSNLGIEWFTYLGGSGWDYANDIVVNQHEEIFVTGDTRSSDFPVKNYYQNESAGTSDAFIAKISSDGSTLEFSTYFSGSSVDIGNSISLAPNGNSIVITIHTQSDDLFTTDNAYKTSKSSTVGIAVTIWSNDGKLNYASYLDLSSGANSEFDNHVDAEGNLYLTGGTGGTDLITTSNALNSTAGLSTDAFIFQLKIDSSNAPDYLTAGVPSSETNYIHLMWEPVNQINVTYEVYKKVGGGSFQSLVNTSKTEFMDTSVTTNTNYYYKVGVSNIFGGSFSDVVKVKIEPKVTTETETEYNTTTVTDFQAVINTTENITTDNGFAAFPITTLFFISFGLMAIYRKRRTN